MTSARQARCPNKDIRVTCVTYREFQLRAYPCRMLRPCAGIAVILVFTAISAAGATRVRAKKPHYTALGAARTVPYSVEGDPDGAKPGETTLRVRPLVVNGIVKDWTTGEDHPITEWSFTVRGAIRMNDALPTDSKEHWVWQRGPWLLVDKESGKITTLRLPDYSSAVSNVVWFRNYAAYCGLSPGGKTLYAIVTQVPARKPLVRQKLSPWKATGQMTACAPAVWQRDPLQVSFAPTGGTSVSFTLAGSSAIAPRGDNVAASPAPTPAQ